MSDDEALTRTGTGRYIWAPRRRLPALESGLWPAGLQAGVQVEYERRGDAIASRCLHASRLAACAARYPPLGDNGREGFVRPVCRVLTPARVQAC